MQNDIWWFMKFFITLSAVSVSIAALILFFVEAFDHRNDFWALWFGFFVLLTIAGLFGLGISSLIWMWV